MSSLWSELKYDPCWFRAWMEDGIDILGELEGLQIEFCGILRDNADSDRSAVAAMVGYVRSSSHAPSSIQQVLLRMSTLDRKRPFLVRDVSVIVSSVQPHRDHAFVVY